MSNTLINAWKGIHLFCLNHEEPKEMELLTNTEKIKTPFYRCSDEKCPNRVNLDDYQRLIMSFLERMESEPFADFTNFSFSHKGTRQKVYVRCLSHKTGNIKIGTYNETVFGKVYKR